MKPVILISASEDKGGRYGLARYALYKNYAAAVSASGGIPIIAAGADAKEYCEIADGLILSGGLDVSPEYFNQKLPDNGLVKIQPERDEYELNLFAAFFGQNKPVFGICRGIQLINVAAGGDLIMDIPSETGENHAECEHEVNFEQGTQLYNLLGAGRKTNSFHHQAVKTIGTGFAVSGVSADGIIEAIEHKDKPVFGVQFHPERMAEMNILFSHLVHLCVKV